MNGPMTCEKCRFFDVTGMCCRRYPPSFRAPDEVPHDWWPAVRPTDFCGEFQEWPKMEPRP